MTDQAEIPDAELHAYIDGALDADRKAEFEGRLGRDLELRERMARFRADKEMLKELYGPLARRPVPATWLATLHDARRGGSVSLRLVGSIAAVLILAVAATFAFLSYEHPKTAGIVEAALEARATDAGIVLPVARSASLQSYDGMLGAVIRTPVKVPDMTRLGYSLVGIRLFRTHSAAELIYRDGGNRLFTLYLHKSNGSSRFDQFERDGLRVCVWQDEDLGTVMAGNVSTAAMQRLASLAYTELTL